MKDVKPGQAPEPMLRVALMAYALIMRIGLPFMIAYFRWRGRHDKLYAKHIGERFGKNVAGFEKSVWVHATSLGEVRSAVPLIERFLAASSNVVVTVHTPVGRREVMRIFADEIKDARLCVTYTPLEIKSSWKNFFDAFNPKFGLVMEIEMWPCMIYSARSLGVPLFMCNAQYPTQSYVRDKRYFPIRLRLVKGFAGIMAKSDRHAERFRSLGAKKVEVTGELRFDQEVPATQLEAGAKAREWLGATKRVVVVFSSVVKGEEAYYVEVMKSVAKGLEKRKGKKPLFVFVPRAPEEFDGMEKYLSSSGLFVQKKSTLFDEGLKPMGKAPKIDVLLGDSFGEMHFYMAIGDAVVVGGGFVPKGAHNIIEALSQTKPVFVGPETRTIEYPMIEAMEDRVANKSKTSQEMSEALLAEMGKKIKRERIEAFCAKHGDSATKTLDALEKLLGVSPISD